MRCYIYRVQHKINGKSYIGFTTQQLYERMKQHAYEALKGSTTLFHKAIRKYGLQAFEWTTLHKSDDENNCLNVMEPWFIKEYNAIGKNGYNIAEGGQRGPRMPGKTNPMYGRTHSAVVLTKLADCAAERFKGKSYEELYGTEKATTLRQQRSQALKKRRRLDPPVGSKNANFDRTEYEFVHQTGRTLCGTIYDLRQHDPALTKENTWRIKNGGTSKGWSLKSNPIHIGR